MRERVTTDQIKLARTVDLISYMQRYEPEELIRTGPHDYKTATHSSLCISDNGLSICCTFKTELLCCLF